MSIPMYEKNDPNMNHSDKEKKFEALAQAAEFCKNHALYLSLAALFLVLLSVIIWALGGQGADDNSKDEPDAMTDAEALPQDEGYQKDQFPEINMLISNYYTAYANGDIDTLAAIAAPISEEEKSYISILSEYVEGYENIGCYTKSGLDADSYVAAVYMEVKFKGAQTATPGLETFYVRKREDGSFYIDNLYGQFNTKIIKKLYGQFDPGSHGYEVDAAVAAKIDAFSQQEDIVALQTDVWQKYDAALAADADLKTVVDTTVANAIAVWASDQVAAIRKAEGEKAAAEEAAKKAAEEEAKRQEEEAKRAAELASAVAVYATAKVNVRAQASETAEVLGQLEKGAQTTLLENKDGWGRIDYKDGKQGYVKAEYLAAAGAQPPAESTAQTETPPAEEEGGQSSGSLAEGTVVRLKETVNVRKSMGSDSDKVATAFAGEKVTVIMSYAEGWTKVEYAGKTGFIKTSLLQ